MNSADDPKKNNRRTISRRTVLSYGLGTAGSLLLPACATRGLRGPASTVHSENIAIIGAGASGIAAAQELKVRGFQNVTVLEARARIGGRIHTIHASDNSLYELGAGWVHGHIDNSIRELMKELNFPLIRSGDNSDTQIWDARGLPVTRKESRKRYQKYASYIANIREKARDGETLAEAIRRIGPAPDIWNQHFLRSNIVETEGADLDQLAAPESKAEGGADGHDYIPGAGYTAFLENFTNQMPIRLNAKVQSIAMIGDRVRLTILENGRERTEDFAAVICTLPLGVLKKNPQIFDFALPQWKKDVIGSMGFGHFAKLFLQFPEVFWLPDARWMERMGEPQRITQFYPLNQMTGSKTLIAIAGGTNALRWQDATEAQMRELAMRQLRQQFGQRIPDPLQIVRTEWSQDPFTMGAYSYPGRTTSVTDYEKLAAPLNGRLFFAGEATNAADYGTVHGAWDSGRKAAARVAEKFG